MFNAAESAIFGRDIERVRSIVVRLFFLVCTFVVYFQFQKARWTQAAEKIRLHTRWEDLLRDPDLCVYVAKAMVWAKSVLISLSVQSKMFA